MNDSHGPPTRPSLLIQIREKSDGQAWAEFVDTYSTVILKYCARWQMSRSDADDVLQEVLRRVVTSIENFEYDPSKGLFRFWLRRVTRNEIQRHWRRRGADQQPILGADSNGLLDGEAAADTAWNEDFLVSILERAMARVRPCFDEQTWDVFLRVWRDNDPPKMVAEEIGRTRSWVDKAKFRVKERLVEEVVYLSHDEALPML